MARLLNEAGVSGSPISSVEPLTGGVSSDIVKITLGDSGQFCAKRALPALKVADNWEAPVSRSRFEAAWLRVAASIVPDVAPGVLAENPDDNAFLMPYLSPDEAPPWKAELLAGRYDARVPAAVADALARIHAATWGDPGTARTFETDTAFDALRLDPYLRTLAQRRPDLSQPVLSVLETTAAAKLALVHGDVSPKNILVHRRNGHPVFLDAECAWFGDPAFDAAFCINHLLLKALHLSALRNDLLNGAEAFLATWTAGLPAPERAAAEARCLALLPCLMLARVDGKSPVEYLSEAERDCVRRLAPAFIREPPDRLALLAAAVRNEAETKPGAGW